MKVYILLSTRTDPWERGEEGCTVTVEGVYTCQADAETDKVIKDAEWFEEWQDGDPDKEREEPESWTYYDIVEKELK